MKVPFFLRRQAAKPLQDISAGKLPDVHLPEGADLDDRQGMSEKTVRRIESVAEKVITHTVAKSWAKKDLAGQVRIARGLMAVVGLDTFRARFLRDFPHDLKAMRKKGATDAEILDYYFNCEAFVRFWTDLGMDRSHMEALLAELPA
ncbi:MAG: hypothetical protein JRN35_06110 [Nitrososphaerota archaeon]|nr:hypothetical protein [Nitrososphaerota archaeon]